MTNSEANEKTWGVHSTKLDQYYLEWDFLPSNTVLFKRN